MKVAASILFGSAAICGLFPSLTYALDLRPRYHTSVFDGVVVRRPYFADGGKKYGLIIDGETEIIKLGEGAELRFRTIKQSSVSLKLSPLSADLPFVADTLERYQKAAMAILPRDAQEAALEEKVADPFPINGWRSFRFIFTYRLGSVSMRESVTFLNLNPKQQIVVRASSRQQDWEQVASRSDDVIVRWHEIRPDEGTYN